MISISPAKEDYLRAMFVLEEQNGELKSVDVARYVGVSKPTVSEMMKRLDSEGLVKSEKYAKLELTPRGKAIATNLTAKHRLIELFLERVLGRKKDLHEEAHRLEHAFTDESIAAMRRLLHNPKEDPHGKPIPR